MSKEAIKQNTPKYPHSDRVFVNPSRIIANSFPMFLADSSLFLVKQLELYSPNIAVELKALQLAGDNAAFALEEAHIDRFEIIPLAEESIETDNTPTEYPVLPINILNDNDDALINLKADMGAEWTLPAVAREASREFPRIVESKKQDSGLELDTSTISTADTISEPINPPIIEYIANSTTPFENNEAITLLINDVIKPTDKSHIANPDAHLVVKTTMMPLAGLVFGKSRKSEKELDRILSSIQKIFEYRAHSRSSSMTSASDQDNTDLPLGKMRHSDSLFTIQREIDVLNMTLNKSELIEVTDILGLPRFFNRALFERCRAYSDDKAGERITFSNFTRFDKYAYSRLWRSLSKGIDNYSMAFHLLAQEGSKYLIPNDLESVLYGKLVLFNNGAEVAETHQGLIFLRGEPMNEFRKRYVETVIARLYFLKRNNGSERITFAEFRNSVFMTCLIDLETNKDINASRSVFSYKHFYVIYCKFWELDHNHDMFIEESDFCTFSNNSITRIVMDRILDGAARPLSSFPKTSKEYVKQSFLSKRISYYDFVLFILACEDKGIASSIEYWFRVLDTDSDGFLSMYELLPFWAEQNQRMIQWRIGDPWSFEDFICVVIDLIKPVDPCRITISDLKRSGENCISFFDMLFDIQKYEHTLKRLDPGFREYDDIFVTDSNHPLTKVKLEGWQKFAERSYEQLIFEESKESNESLNTFEYQEELDVNWSRSSGFDVTSEWEDGSHLV